MTKLCICCVRSYNPFFLHFKNVAAIGLTITSAGGSDYISKACGLAALPAGKLCIQAFRLRPRLEGAASQKPRLWPGLWFSCEFPQPPAPVSGFPGLRLVRRALGRPAPPGFRDTHCLSCQSAARGFQRGPALRVPPPAAQPSPSSRHFTPHNHQGKSPGVRSAF